MADCKKQLAPEQYKVCWNKGTGPLFSGEYNKTEDKGAYNLLSLARGATNEQ